MGYPRDAENGQGLVEYALILVLIAIVVIAILTLLGGNVNMVFARILLQIEHPGDYSGDPVTVTNFNVSTVGGCSYGVCNVTASASATLNGATGSPRVCVQFNDSNGGGKLACGSPPTASFSGSGSSGNLEGCVVAVEGYSLSGGAYCSSTSY